MKAGDSMHKEESVSIYRITVEGKLHKRWTDWFSGMHITHQVEQNTVPVTILQGPVPDQSALRGILSKLWDLNLTLIYVERLDTVKPKENENG
jgi:hypothetical protein